MLLNKIMREIKVILIFCAFLFCVSFSLQGQNTILLLQSQSIAFQKTLTIKPSLLFSSIFESPFHKILYEKEMCSRILGTNLMLHCRKHDMFRDIYRITKHLDGYRKFKSKCGKVNYKINDDKFTIKINLNRLSSSS